MKRAPIKYEILELLSKHSLTASQVVKKLKSAGARNALRHLSEKGFLSARKRTTAKTLWYSITESGKQELARKSGAAEEKTTGLVERHLRKLDAEEARKTFLKSKNQRPVQRVDYHPNWNRILNCARKNREFAYLDLSK